MKNAPPTGGHVFSLIWTIFELPCFLTDWNHFRTQLSYQGNKIPTKFHENWAKNVTSRKNAPPTGGHVLSPNWTIFILVRDINKTNVFTNFHDDWAKIVTSRVFTRKTAPPTSDHTNISLRQTF
ncbi:hypothetical protein DPMN_103560 [Dreissena polymorpha]|uniref:Uncharacterized protein n=1 Tax=Dreissena polymorpha TaxID=45954 RepID=A0A9D4H693_DREPO|nr:hypothetical protein DPMN_103560 [Dreissena polymorpha]